MRYVFKVFCHLGGEFHWPVVRGAAGIAKSEVIKMVQRPVCLCDGKLIGIESIFTIDSIGRQINIEEKVEALRKRSHNNDLFCPCGCGANLILVAGDRGVRRQHFRLRSSSLKQKRLYPVKLISSTNPLNIYLIIINFQLKTLLETIQIKGSSSRSIISLFHISDAGFHYRKSS